MVSSARRARGARIGIQANYTCIFLHWVALSPFGVFRIGFPLDYRPPPWLIAHYCGFIIVLAAYFSTSVVLVRAGGEGQILVASKAYTVSNVLHGLSLIALGFSFAYVMWVRW